MKAVILAGGEGTRLRPLTCNMPKAMVPILNRPFLEHMLSHLMGNGVKDVILTLSYLPDRIQEHFGNGDSVDMGLSYVLEETPLGTAGAVKNVERSLDGTFLVLNGDVLTDLDLEAMVRFHRQKSALVTLFLTPVDDPSAFGVVETRADGRVLRFLEKPAPGETESNWINGGIYLVEPEAMAHVPPGEFYMFERGLFPRLLDMGAPVYGFKATPYWIDVGTPSNYMKVHRDLLHDSYRGALTRALNAYAGRSYVDPSARIVGSVLLGEGCVVGPGATIQGPAILGDGCEVAKEALIVSSVLWQGVVLGESAALKGCIVGLGARIGQGSTVGEGCILGDNVTVGRDNHLEKGIVLWPDRVIEPGSISFQ
ncbi:MAG: NDP-sugar synthase [Chloroflexi bacterium]|nr:NDP-sugar synthase [Chloroflexota bacterium]